MVFTSAVIGSADAVAVLLPVVLMAVIWAVVLAADGVLMVLSVDDSVDVCSFAAVSVVPVVVSGAVLPAVEVVVVVVELLDDRRVRASGRCEEPAPDAVDDAVVRLAEEVPAVPSVAADDGAVALGPRAVWPVGFFADAEREDPEFDVAEFAEPDEELWSVSSALATATTGPARDNPSTKAATPALAPR
ncbi:hypothetical protein [Mycobacterium sp. RTGN5]|uniref:hypothetical protein n=1 Tax=Mycobacterium sp. RTGN5 TaxID=3016522 RepID=UPI0029C70B18|nr:hypothetical protein [Mycobacterium sp. RTGN5]